MRRQVSSPVPRRSTPIILGIVSRRHWGQTRLTAAGFTAFGDLGGILTNFFGNFLLLVTPYTLVVAVISCPGLAGRETNYSSILGSETETR